MKRAWCAPFLAAGFAGAAPDSPGRVVSEESLRQLAGKVLVFATPEYPPAALRDKVEATVEVIGTLHPDGSFEAKSIESSSARPEFRRALSDVTRLWLLRPAYGFDCMPRASTVTVRVWFEVKQGEGSISVSQPVVDGPRSSPDIVLRRIRGADPPYPYEAWKLRLEADIESLLRVMPSGEVHSVTVVPGPAVRFFRREVATALSQWRFEPHSAGGSVCYRVENRFRQTD